MRDHPRLRGEKGPARHPCSTTQGSPPLTRGKAAPVPSPEEEPRITPAYAGKSELAETERGENGDHPRLRGEKGALSSPCEMYRGSPPLTRGKDIYDDSVIRDSRITPAYAGKRQEGTQKITEALDHPRLRGEKSSMFFERTPAAGSPPLTRGKAPKSPTYPEILGITPAYAGKSAIFFSAPPLPRGIYKLLSPYRITSATAEKASRAHCHRRRGAPPVISEHFYYTCSTAETQFPFSREFSRDFP